MKVLVFCCKPCRRYRKVCYCPQLLPTDSCHCPEVTQWAIPLVSFRHSTWSTAVWFSFHIWRNRIVYIHLFFKHFSSSYLRVTVFCLRGFFFIYTKWESVYWRLSLLPFLPMQTTSSPLMAFLCCGFPAFYYFAKTYLILATMWGIAVDTGDVAAQFSTVSPESDWGVRSLWDAHKLPLNYIPSWSFMICLNGACTRRNPATRRAFAV